MRAMPSPTCRTVPTSARSVSTSYCSIRCLRIEVISSGLSFMPSLLLAAPVRRGRARVSAVPVSPARSRRRGASRPAGRCRRPGRGRPSASPPPSYPRPARSAARSPRPPRRSARAPSSARRSGAAPPGPRAARTPSRSPPAPPRAPSPPRAGGSASEAAPRRRRGRRGSPPSRSTRAAGCGARRAAPATRQPPGRSRRAPRGPAAAGRRPSPPRTTPRRRCGARPPLDGLLQAGEVEAGDRLLDQGAVALGVEGAPDDAGSGLQGEVGDLGADLLQRPRRLGGDLPPRLLEAALPLGFGLLAHPLLHRLARAAGLGQDRLGLALGLPDQAAVLLEQPLCLVACLVGRLDRPPDRLAALVDQRLDPAEGELLEGEEDDQEEDDRPDHQPRDDLGERARGGDEHLLDQDEAQEATDEAVEHDGLGEREAEPHDPLQLPAQLG